MTDVIKILVVDDNPHMLKGVTRLFRINGFEVEEALNGTMAMELAGTYRPDLILLDVNLPDINGIEVCRRLKSDPDTANIFIVHLSAMHTNTSSQVEGLEAGADGYIVQPISNQELLARIQSLSRIISAEKELHSRKQEFEALVQNAPDLIARIDENLAYSYVNPAVSRVFGRKPDEILGNTHQSAGLTEPAYQKLEAAASSVLSGGTENMIELEITRGETTSWFQVRLAPERNVQGHIHSVLCIFSDITERKIAEGEIRLLNKDLEKRVEHRTAELALTNQNLEAEIAERKKTEYALRKSEARMRQITDNMNDIVLVTDNDGIVTYITPSVTTSLGIEPRECIGQQLSRFFDESDKGKIEEVIAIISKTGVSGSREFNLTHKNGTTYCFEIISGPLLDDQNGIVGVIGGARNITERKMSEEALRQRTDELALANSKLAKASKLKDEFLSSMSHELRTPLIAVLGISEALQEEVYGTLTEKQHKSLRTIEESGRHLLSLINDILDISKIEAGKMELQYAPIYIDSLCQSSIQFVRHSAQEKNLDLQLHIEKNTEKVLGDERRLKQILVNLLGNAVKFTEEGGRVGLDVRTDVESEAVEFVVWDTGIGIAPDQMERLFQPFVQLDSSLSRQYNGSGLGLSIVRKLIDLHGGSINLESREGEGSRFTVRLNRYNESDATGQNEIDQIMDISDFPANSNILVIQESESEYSQIKRYLLDAGIKASFLNPANGYLQHAGDLNPDLIILDYNLPDDAGKVVKSLRGTEGLANIPVIVTSLVKSSSAELNGPDVVFLTKPVMRQQLYHTLRDLSELKVNGDILPINGPDKNGHMAEQVLKILLGDENDRVIRYFSEYAKNRSFELITAASGEEVLRFTGEYTPDVIIMDYSLAGLDALEAIRIIRENHHPGEVKIVITNGQNLPWSQENALTAGADYYLIRPFSSKRLDKIIQPEGILMPSDH
ncbi:MAG: response regulator [Balneolaceae bacterium]|nr:MAG: response regulator [Balneolaceae bacterium]